MLGVNRVPSGGDAGARLQCEERTQHPHRFPSILNDVSIKSN